LRESPARRPRWRESTDPFGKSSIIAVKRSGLKIERTPSLRVAAGKRGFAGGNAALI
jgi:hypothetical protein